MKKNIVCLLFCGFLSISSQAQSFGGGISIGLSTSQISGDHLGGFNKIGLISGVYTNLKIKKNLSAQFEITYIEKGSKNPNIQEDNLAEISLSYAEIPISISLQQNKDIKIEAGILPAFIIKSEMNDLYSEISISPKFSSYDFGVFLGLNYSITEKIILNSRISNSIIPIRSHVSEATSGLNKGQYNTVLSFTLYYSIL